MQAKRAFIMLWLAAEALFVWSGFAPRHSLLDDRPLPYPYQGIALLSLLALGELAVVYFVIFRQPRSFALQFWLFFLVVSVLMLYSALTTLHSDLIVAAHALWLVLLSLLAGWYLLRRK